MGSSGSSIGSGSGSPASFVAMPSFRPLAHNRKSAAESVQVVIWWWWRRSPRMGRWKNLAVRQRKATDMHVQCSAIVAGKPGAEDPTRQLSSCWRTLWQPARELAGVLVRTSWSQQHPYSTHPRAFRPGGKAIQTDVRLKLVAAQVTCNMGRLQRPCIGANSQPTLRRHVLKYLTPPGGN